MRSKVKVITGVIIVIVSSDCEYVNVVAPISHVLLLLVGVNTLPKDSPSNVTVAFRISMFLVRSGKNVHVPLIMSVLLLRKG